MYNVLIVDDDTLMRNALRAMISRFKNFQIIGEAANGAEAIAICRLYPVHLIFMDIIMPGMTGIEAGKKIKEDSPSDRNMHPLCLLRLSFCQRSNGITYQKILFQASIFS